MGVGSEALACCPVSALPAPANRGDSTHGNFWGCTGPGGVGVRSLKCTFLQWPLGAVSPPHQGHCVP